MPFSQCLRPFGTPQCLLPVVEKSNDTNHCNRSTICYNGNMNHISARPPNTLLPVPERITFSLTADAKARLYQLAKDEKRSISSLMQFIIDNYLERGKEQK